VELTKRKEKKWNGCRFHFPARWTRFPARLQRFPARWLPSKVLRSQNKYRGLVVDIMGKKKIILVFQMEICGGRKVRDKVKIEIFKFYQSRKQIGAFWRGRREGRTGGNFVTNGGRSMTVGGREEEWRWVFWERSSLEFVRTERKRVSRSDKLLEKNKREKGKK